MADQLDTATSRACPACGCILEKRIGDAPSAFARRKYCSNHCARTSACKRDAAERFNEKVDQASTFGPRGDCLRWMAGHNRDGYGTFHMAGCGGLAHRAAYLLHFGALPATAHVLHRCDNPGCVNPAHLFLGSHDENMKDMAAKGRARPPKGSRHTSAKLGEGDVISILSDLRSNDALAAVYGVTKVAIRYIRSGRTWKHVPRPTRQGRERYNVPSRS